MSYNTYPTPEFDKNIKFYHKVKKFLKVDDDVDQLVVDLEKGNLIGNRMEDLDLPLDTSVYKARISNSSTRVGKSNGFRVIYYILNANKEIYLLTIYSKKDEGNIPDSEIKKLIKKYCPCP